MEKKEKEAKRERGGSRCPVSSVYRLVGLWLDPQEETLSSLGFCFGNLTTDSLDRTPTLTALSLQYDPDDLKGIGW